MYAQWVHVADLQLLGVAERDRRQDGAGPFRFFKDTLFPLSVTTCAALFVIQFIYGWNQYLWPLLITTQDSMQTIVTGIKKMLTTTDELAEWQLAMATAVLAMLPPVGMNIFIASARFGVPATTIVRASLPFYALLLFVILSVFVAGEAFVAFEILKVSSLQHEGSILGAHARHGIGDQSNSVGALRRKRGPDQNGIDMDPVNDETGGQPVLRQRRAAQAMPGSIDIDFSQKALVMANLS